MRAALGLDAVRPRARIRDVLGCIGLGIPGLAILAAPLLGVLALVLAFVRTD